jgi:hypothetical protein
VKRRRICICILGCIAAVALAFTFWPREHEPEYNGVKLSVWLDRYEYSNTPGAGYTAVCAIGTNSLPFLLDWIQHETPAWKRYARQTAPKMPAMVQKNRFVRWLLADPRELRANAAVSGFQLLGPRAEPARPELQRLVWDSRPGKRQTSRRARLSIMRMEQSSPTQQSSPTNYAEWLFP